MIFLAWFCLLCKGTVADFWEVWQVWKLCVFRVVDLEGLVDWKLVFTGKVLEGKQWATVGIRK